MQTQAQAQTATPSASTNAPSLEAYILDHEHRLQAIAANNAEIIEHLNKLGQLRGQQKAESDQATREHLKEIAALKTEVASMRSLLSVCLAGIVGVMFLAATSSIFQGQKINQLQEKLNVESRQSHPAQARKN